MQSLVSLWKILNVAEKRQATALLLLVIIMALTEAAGVASIMPFIALLTNQELVQTDARLNFLYQAFEFANTNDFLVFFGLFVLSLLVVSLLIKALTTYLQLRFVLFREYSIGQRLLSCYFERPYVWYLERNTADLGKSVLSEVNSIINNALIPCYVYNAGCCCNRDPRTFIGGKSISFCGCRKCIGWQLLIDLHYF